MEARGTLGEILLPLLVGYGVFEEFGLVLLCGLVATFGEGGPFEEVGSVEAVQVGGDDDVGEATGEALVPLDGDREAALEDVDEGVEIVWADGRDGEAEGEDDVGAHVADGLCREVVEDGTVDELVAAYGEGAIGSWDGDGGADGVGYGPMIEGDGLCRVEICGEAAQRNGERIEVGGVVVAEELAIEEGVESLIGEE